MTIGQHSQILRIDRNYRLGTVINKATHKSVLPSARDQESQSRRPRWATSILETNHDGRIYLTEQLAYEIFLHLAMNRDRKCADDTPLILGVSGPPGCGKTTGIAATLQRIEYVLVRIQACELESQYSNVPAERLCAGYLTASRGQTKTDRPHVLVIDDFDMASSVDSDTSKTTNLQFMLVAMMNICDDPYRVSGESTERIPIIISGNNLSNIHGPVTRSMRMRTVALELSETDRARIAAHILRGVLTDTQVTGLVAGQPDWPIAGFRQLKGLLMRRDFNRRHHGKTATEILRDLMSQTQEAPSPGHCGGSFTQTELDAAVAAVNKEASAKRDFIGN